MKKLRVYVAGKVSKDSHFGTHDWRSAFVAELSKISGRELINVDPTKSDLPQNNTEAVFGGDAYMIKQSDVIIAYLSDDISIGGSQEILIAKYFNKPVIGLAPHGGKFNGSTKEYFGAIVENYQDPFVFATCDIVCGSVQQTGEVLESIEAITPKGIDIIGKLVERFVSEDLVKNTYLTDILAD